MLRGNTYWLVVKVKGVKYRESLRTSDVKAARRFRDARIKEIENEVHRGVTSRSWKDAVAAWATHVDGQLAASTLKRYGVSLAQCEPYLSNLTIDKIAGGAGLNDLIAARRREEAKPATVRRDLTAISQVLTYSEEMGWSEGNPTLTKRKLLKERRDPITLPKDEAISEILEASSDRFGALIVAARLSGCRQNELVTCTWQNFNPKLKQMTVIGKANKRRKIDLSDAAVAHWKAQTPVRGSDLIFCQDNGEPFSAAASDYIHVRGEVMARNENHERFRFHDLRHLFAVRALEGGMSIYKLSKHLGHTSVKTTEIYLDHLTADEQEEARNGSEVLTEVVRSGARGVRGAQKGTQSRLDTGNVN